MSIRMQLSLGLLFSFFSISHPLYGQQSPKPVIRTLSKAPNWLQHDPTLTDYEILQAAEVALTAPAGADVLQLNLFDDHSYTGLLQRLEAHPNGATSWVGVLEDQPSSQVIFSEVGGVFWAKIQTETGAVFLLKPMPGNLNYQLLRIGAGNFGEELCHLAKVEPPALDDPGGTPAPEKVVGICDAGAVCSALTIDLLVVYSAAARTALGGSDAAAQAAIALAVSELNTVCANSGVSHNYALAHSALVNYTETGNASTDLNSLRDADDGVMDEVYDWRDYYYADLVALILDTGGCGLGNVNVNPSVYYSDAAFSIVRDDCMTGNLSLSHELGHNMGFRHDRYAYSATPSNACDYSWGWVNPEAFTGGASARWRTVMAYNAECSDAGIFCTRIPHWSNPAILYNGDPTGSAIGNSDEANNAYLLDRSACLVQDFRVPVSCIAGCNFFQASANYNPATSSGPGNLTSVTLNGPFPSLTGGQGSAELCIYYRGDHSFATEVFNVLDENGTTIGQTVATTDCTIPARICFTLSAAAYNSWIADNAVTFSLDPINTQIDPFLCNAYNRASFELLVTPPSLPVEFTRFEAQAKGQDIELQWSTAWEVDNSHFEVEHSLDGLHFAKVGEVATQGNGRQALDYQFLLTAPGTGVHYLRLRQVDLDGTATLTAIKTVALEEKDAMPFTLFPNPAHTQLFIQSRRQVDWPAMDMYVYDNQGKRISLPQQTDGNQLQLSLEQLQKGLYILVFREKSSGKLWGNSTFLKH